MKLTYHYYEQDYCPPEEIAAGTYKRHVTTCNHRDQIDTSLPFCMNCISIYNSDANIEKFNLGIDFAPPQYIIKDRCEDRLVLNFIIRGKGYINGEPFCSGNFYYTMPLEKHTMVSDFNDPWVSVWIGISGKYIGKVLEILKQKSAKSILSIEKRGDIRAITETLLYRTDLGNSSVEYLKALITIYLSYVLNSKESDPPELLTTSKKAALVRAAKRHIRNNLRDVTVSEVAETLHYGRKYFSRIFDEVVGMTPQEYIVDCKMEWVKNALIQTRLSINEIMDAVGYEHRNGLATTFRKKYGCSPSEYRKKFQSSNKIDNEDIYDIDK
ncbi:MAG: helix-turn-helix domain-containing protein [Clostridia bacterium]|nr:helix-turn-helix domain-containing protein [Clostridia bacterium]